MSLYIPVVLGTARSGRKSSLVANYVLSFVKKLDLETELIDIRDFSQNFTHQAQEKIKDWQTKAQRANGLIIVSPEYNHGYPGELKIFLDNITQELSYKPVGLVGVSSGIFGGVRMMENLKPVLLTLQMVPINISVNFGKVDSLFDETGNIKDEIIWQKKLSVLMEQIVYQAKILSFKDKVV